MRSRIPRFRTRFHNERVAQREAGCRLFARLRGRGDDRQFRRRVARAASFLGQPRQRILAERMRNQLRSQLNLTSEQMDRASAIFDKTAGQLEAIRTDTARRVQETIAEVHRQLASDLTPEQRAKLKEIDRRQSTCLRREGFRRNPGGPQPP